jgi:preprotein translocase subunit SecF
MEFLVGTNINFLGHRRGAFVLSAALILAGLISLAVHGGPKMGIDFAGGILLQVQFEDPMAAQSIRETLSELGLGDAQIQQFGNGREAIIRTKGGEGDGGEDLTGVIVNALNAAHPENQADVRRQELVGPKVGAELRNKATLAILYSLVLILIYISIRFEFRFAVGAVVALVHDVLVTLGMFSLTGRELSLPVIAAFLTVVGYSLNDTIVIYDRIREDRRKLYGKSFVEIVNTSLNESLSRTLVTSLTTLLVVVCIFFLGGEVIKDFAFALMVGVIVGTYSSIYVASPLVVEWEIHSEARRRRKRAK